MALPSRSSLIGIGVLLLLPLLDFILPAELQIADPMRGIFIFSILGLGINIVTGYTGLLHLGVAAFMALGAYGYSILSCDIYPFQLGFWLSLILSVVLGAMWGVLLGIPTLRLRGDYLAIVTLGFGEIVQDMLRNLEVITRGTQGINPLPAPTLFGYTFEPANYYPWYYLLFAILLLVCWLNYNLERSRAGRALKSLREDELASRCMGIAPVKTKLLSFAMCAGLCSLAGALWASSLGSSGEPGNYDFQISILALCIMIVGGMGSIKGVLLGALVMRGFNTMVLDRISTLMVSKGWISTTNVFAAPNNWKYMIFGLALILVMRYRPQGLLPATRHTTANSTQ